MFRAKTARDQHPDPGGPSATRRDHGPSEAGRLARGEGYQPDEAGRQGWLKRVYGARTGSSSMSARQPRKSLKFRRSR